MNNNIPEGYDENGVYRGNGRWYDDEEDVEGIGTFDEYDFLKEVDKGHFVECAKCQELVNIKDTITTYYGTGYLCQKCIKEFNI